jgi:hypothetical protein
VNFCFFKLNFNLFSENLDNSFVFLCLWISKYFVILFWETQRTPPLSSWKVMPFFHFASHGAFSQVIF